MLSRLSQLVGKSRCTITFGCPLIPTFDGLPPPTPANGKKLRLLFFLPSVTAKGSLLCVCSLDQTADLPCSSTPCYHTPHLCIYPASVDRRQATRNLHVILLPMAHSVIHFFLAKDARNVPTVWCFLLMEAVSYITLRTFLVVSLEREVIKKRGKASPFFFT